MRPEDLLDVALERVEELQGGLRRVLAVQPRLRHVVVNAAGERPDAVDAAGLLRDIEEQTVSRVVGRLWEPVEEFLLAGKDIGPAPAAFAGDAPGKRANLVMAEGTGEHPSPVAVRQPVEERDLAPPLPTQAGCVNHPSFQPLRLPPELFRRFFLHFEGFLKFFPLSRNKGT